MCVRNALSSLLPYGLTGVRKCRFHGGMETPRCPRCGGEMKKNGKTSAGRTRWRCKDTGCGVSRSRAYDRQADDVRAFLNWLLSADTQEGRGVSARTLRRRNELGWSLWPPCPMGGQVHDVVHLDGIHCLCSMFFKQFGRYFSAVGAAGFSQCWQCVWTGGLNEEGIGPPDLYVPEL